jgi:hypothetical protein
MPEDKKKSGLLAGCNYLSVGVFGGRFKNLTIPPLTILKLRRI